VARPRRFGALVLAFLVAGCSAQVAAPRPSATPVATPGMSETPRPTNASTDVIYLRLNGGPSATILAIEDEPLNASLLRAILSPAGYDLHIEPTLADARDWLEGSTPAWTAEL